jgi:hypothetical protein
MAGNAQSCCALDGLIQRTEDMRPARATARTSASPSERVPAMARPCPQRGYPTRVEPAELNVADDRRESAVELDAARFELRMPRREPRRRFQIQHVLRRRSRAPRNQRARSVAITTNVHVVVQRGNMRARQPRLQRGRLFETQQRLREPAVGDQQVAREDVTFPLLDIGAGARMPAEMIPDRAALRPLERRHGVHERVVIDVHVCGIQDANALVAVHENISSADRISRDLEEEAIDGALDPVMHENAIHVADVVPNAVGVRLLDPFDPTPGHAARRSHA